MLKCLCGREVAHMYMVENLASQAGKLSQISQQVSNLLLEEALTARCDIFFFFFEAGAYIH
jgi:hypothetical protein